mmetsp:Transcript_15971/g.53867  ORF Transcript_15971/g.53867 Transcript_15971/m.53867 type:complete len:223 (+) Transcript_15971:105-773(+)
MPSDEGLSGATEPGARPSLGGDLRNAPSIFLNSAPDGVEVPDGEEPPGNETRLRSEDADGVDVSGSELRPRSDTDAPRAGVALPWKAARCSSVCARRGVSAAGSVSVASESGRSLPYDDDEARSSNASPACGIASVATSALGTEKTSRVKMASAEPSEERRAPVDDAIQPSRASSLIISSSVVGSSPSLASLSARGAGVAVGRSDCALRCGTRGAAAGGCRF